jgi:hypothetical protein
MIMPLGLLIRTARASDNVKHRSEELGLATSGAKGLTLRTNAFEGVMTIGPLLGGCIADLLISTKQEHGNAPTDDDDFKSWLWDEVAGAVPADDADIPKLLGDTPDLLGYQISFADLYPMERVTPGWYVGEAAYRAVYDALRQNLRLPEDVPTG